MANVMEQVPGLAGNTNRSEATSRLHRRAAACAGGSPYMSSFTGLSLGVALGLSVVCASLHEARADSVQSNLSCISEEPQPDDPLRRDCSKALSTPEFPPAVSPPEPPRLPPTFPNYRRQDNGGKERSAGSAQGPRNSGGSGGSDNSRAGTR